MALTKRTGANSFLIWGRQPAFGVPINLFSKMIGRRIPFVSNTLIETGEQVQSESIVGGGSDTKNTTGLLGGGGRVVMEVLPEDIIHLLIGVFNPKILPVSAELTDTTVAKSSTAIGSAITGFANPGGMVQDPVPDGKADNHKWKVPSKLKATLSAAVDNGAKMVVTGKRRIGRVMGQRFPKTDVIEIADGATTVTSDILFDQVDNVTFTNIGSSNNSVTATFAWEPDTYVTEVLLNVDNAQFPGWTWQMNNGGMPIVAYDVIPGNFSLEIGTNVRATIDVTATQVTENRMINDIEAEKFNYDTTVTDAALTNFPRANLSFYPRWGGALLYGADNIKATSRYIERFTGLTLGVNHNYEQTEEIYGSRFIGQPDVGGDGVRQVTMTWDALFRQGSARNDTGFKLWQEIYRDNTTDSVEFNLYNYLDNGRQYRMQYNMPQFQLTAVPGVPVEGRGNIPRRFEGKLVPSDDAVVPNEISIILLTENAYSEAA